MINCPFCKRDLDEEVIVHINSLYRPTIFLKMIQHNDFPMRLMRISIWFKNLFGKGSFMCWIEETDGDVLITGSTIVKGERFDWRKKISTLTLARIMVELEDFSTLLDPKLMDKK